MNKTPDHLNHAFQLHRSGKIREAIEQYVRILPKQKNNAQLLHLLGTAYLQIGQRQQGIAQLQRSLALNPKNPDALNNLGNALKDLKRLDDALASFDKALAIRPDYADAHNNRGVTLKNLKRLDDALASYGKALAIRPDYAEAYYNRGNALLELKRLDDALASYDKALATRPDYAEAYWNKSLLLILSGQYLEGWTLYEWRLKKDNVKNDYYNFSQQFWRGQENIHGKRLLIHAEQGFGDVIQFCRYMPLVKALGAEIILEVPKALVSFVSTLNCPMNVVPKGSKLPEFDAYCPIMSLPYAFKTTLDSIPSETPYLFSNPDKVKRWQDSLGKSDHIRVGLVWSGSKTHKNDHNRGIQFEQLLDLTNLDFIEWHSLQKEYRPLDLEVLKQHPEIHQHQNELSDFSDTAALIECMDLVISVDTSVAHVAGALGKAVWILLPFIPDYRWLMDREDSPWYPSAKLYRQPRHDDCGSVISRIKDDLISFKR